jgi:uncharacterized protein (TIGR03437 family)
MKYEKSPLIIRTLLFACALHAAYAQNTTFTTMSAGSWTNFVAPDSIAAGFGYNFASTTTAASSLPLGTALGNAAVTITDSTGAKFPAPLFMVSPGQINFLIPAVAVGKATLSVTAGNITYSGNVEVSNVSPAIFAANMTGSGIAAAQIIRVSASGQVTTQMPFQTGTTGFVPTPISLLPTTDMVYLVLYGTGIRHRSANPVEATVNGVKVPVLYAGAQSTLPGLDQVNLGPLPQSLTGTGRTGLNIVITVDGIPANITTIDIQ